jgi:hypothetical protein
MAKVTNFTITAQVVIEPPEKAEEIFADFDASYQGQRGDDETPEEFFQRKVEEYIFSIHSALCCQRESVKAYQKIADSLQQSVILRKRKDKPVLPPEAIAPALPKPVAARKKR